MKHLVIVRHGDVDRAGSLTARGKLQMNALAAHLKPVFAGHTIRVISSPEPCATDSAGLLAAALYAVDPVNTHDLLLSDQDHPANTAAAIAVVLTEGKTTGALIVVTHAAHSRTLPSGIRQHLFGCAWPEKMLECGGAVRLNLETKEMRDVK